ncbi:MAG: ATP-binding protein [Ktedonobacterales bacterium]
MTPRNVKQLPAEVDESATWQDAPTLTETEEERLKASLLDTLGLVSHELRSPLTAIRGFAETLRRHESRLPLAERREFLDAITQASDRLEVIISRLLRLSQLEAQTTPMHSMMFDPAALLGEALARYGNEPLNQFDESLPVSQASGVARRAVTPKKTQTPQAYGHRDLTFALQLLDVQGELTPTLPPIVGDPQLLREVIAHLLENAITFTPVGGAICVVARPVLREHAAETAALEIVISDTGVGIPTDHLGRIFERFHQVDNRLERDVSGMGLGLTICKRIVELHNGVIWAENNASGGASFHVALPLALDDKLASVPVFQSTS